ncbi:MAG: GlsB/YeaQ/YmgE family stress response membrane protein [Sphingomonadaceae bacterium]|nr:GlsB/YeaQ/YmgE family stress response membrane protein [Sphingomonadaceae bacterium]
MEGAALGWIFIGIVAGVLARFAAPVRDPGGFIVPILLGIAGALLAGFVGQSAGFYTPTQPGAWISAAIGAIVVLIVYRFAMRRHGA